MRFAVLALLAAASCARNLRSADPANWVELQSEHFVLRTDLPEEDARKGIADLEVIRTALAAAGWHAARASPLRTKVVALATDRELHEFLPDRVAGYAFNTPAGRMIIVGGGGSLLDSTVVKHEVTHTLLHEFLVTNPRWVQEGIACLMETLRIDPSAGEVVRGESEWERRQLFDHRTMRNWSADLMAVGGSFWSLDGFAFETFSWSLIHWLADTRPEQLDELLRRLARGESMWVAMAGAMPGLDEAAIAAGMHEYLQHLRSVQTARFRFTPPPPGQPQIRRMTAAEVHVLRAQLLALKGARAKPQRDGELKLALASDPGDPLALAMTGADLQKAIDLHPDDWHAWVLWMTKHPKDGAALAKAVALAPDEPVVLTLQAAFETEAGRAPAAVALAKRAVALAPGQALLLDVLAGAYAAAGECDAAMDAQQRAIDALPDSVDRETPVQFREHLSTIVNHCGQPASSKPHRTVEVEPVLDKCRQPWALPRAAAKGVRAQFTIRGDGTVTAVAIQGARDNQSAGVIRQFIESCSFEPVTVDGKVRQTQVTLDIDSMLP